jgi:hypothetical protein
VYVIDPNQVIRLILYYPFSTGRNMSEILRIVDSLQAVDRLLAEMTDEQKEEIRSTPLHELWRSRRLPKHRHRFAVARPSEYSKKRDCVRVPAWRSRKGGTADTCARMRMGGGGITSAAACQR